MTPSLHSFLHRIVEAPECPPWARAEAQRLLAAGREPQIQIINGNRYVEGVDFPFVPPVGQEGAA